MRILIVDCAYPGFLADFYRGRPDVAETGFEEQRRAFMAEGFGTCDALSVNLRRLGHEAQEIVVNAEPMQRAWGREHGLEPEPDAPHWQPGILAEQIRTVRPDVLYVQELGPVPDRFWAGVKEHVRLTVAQVACSIPRHRDFRAYDVVMSSWPPLVDHFRSQGKRAEHLRLAFDERVLERLGQVEHRWPVTFVGGIGAVHPERTRLLERLCQDVSLDVWGYVSGGEELPDAIRERYHGQAWGMDMYRVLAGSRITVNHHLVHEVRGQRNFSLANNQRLYEATGVGTLLLTDLKANLPDLLIPAREVATYRDADECVEQVRRFLADEPARRAIAEAGQRRTLTEHTYARRMEELGGLLAAHLD
jgi:spore maturation protein CgeB